MPSGYFSAPKDTLDPDLFTGTILKEEVRTGLLNLLYSDLENDVGLNEPWNWAMAWVAGSGASYQWGNGDLDVLFGIDLPEFLEANPHFPRLSEREIAVHINAILKSRSWPKTRNVTIGGSKNRYEITFYINPGMELDITSIHPYAAYNLTNDGWTVFPDKEPLSVFPKQWEAITHGDFDNAWKIQDLYYGGGPSGKVQGANAARALWRDIHEGRKEAFGEQGAGYADWHNYRYQRAKHTGAASILRNIIADAERDSPVSDIPGPGDIITRAAIRYANPRYYT